MQPTPSTHWAAWTAVSDRKWLRQRGEWGWGPSLIQRGSPPPPLAFGLVHALPGGRKRILLGTVEYFATSMTFTTKCTPPAPSVVTTNSIAQHCPSSPPNPPPEHHRPRWEPQATGAGQPECHAQYRECGIYSPVYSRCWRIVSRKPSFFGKINRSSRMTP